MGQRVKKFSFLSEVHELNLTQGKKASRHVSLSIKQIRGFQKQLIKQKSHLFLAQTALSSYGSLHLTNEAQN